jgi:hypothetical protein
MVKFDFSHYVHVLQIADEKKESEVRYNRGE